MSTTRMSSGPAFTPEKDLARFEDTARRGQRLTGFSLAAHGWRFEDAEPEDVVFDMSYETDPDDHHFDLFRAAGWTPALTYGHIRLLKAAPGTTPVHTGTESRLEEALGNRALFLRYTAEPLLIALCCQPQYSGGMSKRRNRHGRGQRGPVVLPRSYGGRIDRIDPTHAEFFTACLAQAVQQVQMSWMSCPGILDNVVVGAEDVPTMPDWTEGRVPLSSAVDRSDQSPAKVVIYRRPLELRTASRRGLAILVHRTLVEQLSALTGTPVETIDPSIDD